MIKTKAPYPTTHSWVSNSTNNINSLQKLRNMNDLNLESPLFDLNNGSTPWSIRDAVEGVQIFGGIGSGKTSGSGMFIASKYLNNGFGGLVLTVKPDEKATWIAYCKKANRLDDLIIVEPKGEHFFNFLEYESQSRDGGMAITENIVQVLKTVIRANEEKSGGKKDDRFWEDSLDMLMSNIIDLCLIAYDKVTVDLMYSIVQTIPKSKQDFFALVKSDEEENAFKNAYIKARTRIKGLATEWETSIGTEKIVELEMVDYFDRLYNAVPAARTMKIIDAFFTENYIELPEKTRSTIDFSFMGFFMRMMKDPIYSLFCKKSSSFTPEASIDGKIILINLPVKIYDKVGRDMQIMFKYIWQRAMERRYINAKGSPVFLWADEAQNFIHEHDADYQATARSSIVATVYLTQNLPNYYANMGGEKADYRVKSFLGTLGTKIFHANADIETNKYASELIGEGYIEDLSNTRTVAGSYSSSKSISLKLERMVRPEELVNLKTGGKINNKIVEGYMHKQGNPISGAFNFKKIQFKQDN